MKTYHISSSSPWWYGLICLYGVQDTDWEYLESDPEWWEVRFIALSIQN